MKQTAICAAAIAAALACGAQSPASAASGADFYKGRTATWIVTTNPGGGHDFWGRLLARHLQAALPGSKFVVRNKPGAGHILGLNLIYSAKPNGLTMGNFTTGVALAQILGRKGMRADLTKMSWLVKLSSEPRTLIAQKDAPLNNFQDVLNAKKVLKFSASGVGSGSYMDTFMLATAFKIPHKIVLGYSGSQAPLAMMRGEIDLWIGSEDSAQTYVRSGRVKAIAQVGGNIQGVSDIRKFANNKETKAVTRLMYSMGSLSRIAAGPPNIPADRLKALRAAVKTAVDSKEFRDAAARAKRSLDPAFGEEVHKMVVELITQPPEIIALMKKLETVKVDMVKHTGPVTKTKRGGRRVWINYKGKEVRAKISGSRTTVTINGKKTKRKNIKAGMTCTFTYPRAGAEAKSVDCKG
ncbi:MAG: tripartite tricarboxylate transporter substrate-binding protein [Alphaproteobacteria bacterium]|nr:tripartite tricarboxylate transporter substrate-binding protein [Alphaproteobacteria bacterium]